MSAFGGKVDITRTFRNVCFSGFVLTTPARTCPPLPPRRKSFRVPRNAWVSSRQEALLGCPLCAKNGHSINAFIGAVILLLILRLVRRAA